MNIFRSIIYRIRGEYTTEHLISMGMKVGRGFSRMYGTILDPSHCWLIEIGDNVTLAPRVHILCHDASTKSFLGYTKIGRVTIGDNVFVGAGTVILPGVKIGSNVIIGANSTVTHDVPDNTVAAGNPALITCSFDEYCNKERERLACSPCFGEDYTLRASVSMAKRMEQKRALQDKIGYVK